MAHQIAAILAPNLNVPERILLKRRRNPKSRIKTKKQKMNIRKGLVSSFQGPNTIPAFFRQAISSLAILTSAARTIMLLSALSEIKPPGKG